MNSQSTNSSVDDKLYRIRHSLAHVLAQAVLDMRPTSKLGFGPPIADGFYYDFLLSESLSESDFPEIERRMRKILKKDQRFYHENLPIEEALHRINEMQEPHKHEYAEELVSKKNLDKLSFYRNGSFVDMCEGPHVNSTKEIPRDGFKLRNIAGAYWRGDSRGVMMTRIYAWAFSSKEELTEKVVAWEEAQSRDHKRLGRQLDIFAFDNDIGSGMPLWLPNGTVIRDELEKLAVELEFKAGFQRVVTPHLAKEELYLKTGHLPYYQENMFPFMEFIDKKIRSDSVNTETPTVKDRYVLRPMNCPHHHKIFASRPRSYRDLPLRLAEYGQVYRWEESGAVNGLVRVRGMCMNDAHIYCSAEQVKDECKAVMAMYQKIYNILGIKQDKYFFRLSLHDPNDPGKKEKYVDDPSAWHNTELVMREVLDELQLNYTDGIGDAAFYGPKIDVQFTTVTGRNETISTIQLDFVQPKRLQITYKGADGHSHTPYVIHRAPLSTHERMVAFLIEYYGGAFPVWLAPIQVQIITVSDRFLDYANEIKDLLRNQFVRAEHASMGETVARKIREGITRKIPNLLIIGSKEKDYRTVSLRQYQDSKQITMPLERFNTILLEAIAKRQALKINN